MADIIDIERDEPHTVREILCVKCLSRSLSVAHYDLWLRDIECGACGEIGYCIDTGQDVKGPS